MKRGRRVKSELKCCTMGANHAHRKATARATQVCRQLLRSQALTRGLYYLAACDFRSGIAPLHDVFIGPSSDDFDFI